MKEWNDFKKGVWQEKIDVNNFIETNYKEYKSDESFLSGSTDKTKKVWNKCLDLLKLELKNGVLDIDVDNMSGINNFKPGYIDKKNEVIVGLQTDKPLKRIVNPYGGIRMVYDELKAYNYKLNKEIVFLIIYNS